MDRNPYGQRILRYHIELLIFFLQVDQGSTLRKNFISPAGLVTETFTSPEIFMLALILMTTLLKQ